MKSSIRHACGHEEEHAFEGPDYDQRLKQDWLMGELCFFCAKRGEYRRARSAAALRELPQLQAGTTKQAWWAEICRDAVLRECERYVAELHEKARVVSDALSAACTVRMPVFAGDETPEEIIAVVNAFDASLTVEEWEQMEEEGVKECRISEPYYDRLFNAEYLLEDLQRVVKPDFWIARRGKTGEEVLGQISSADLIPWLASE